MKYNELKIQCLFAEKLLSELDIVANVKTISVLLNKKESNIAQHLNRMSPTYYARYADNERSYGCVLKYRAPTKKAKNTIERLSYRLLMDSHLNLKKYVGHMDYTGFYFFEGMDNFKDVFGIDIRMMVLSRIENRTTVLDSWRNHYKEFFEEYKPESPALLILQNFKWYHPYTDRTRMNNLLEIKSKLILENENLNDNEKMLKLTEKAIKHENAKFEAFNG